MAESPQDGVDHTINGDAPARINEHGCKESCSSGRSPIGLPESSSSSTCHSTRADGAFHPPFRGRFPPTRNTGLIRYPPISASRIMEASRPSATHQDRPVSIHNHPSDAPFRRRRVWCALVLKVTSPSTSRVADLPTGTHILVSHPVGMADLGQPAPGKRSDESPVKEN